MLALAATLAAPARAVAADATAGSPTVTIGGNVEQALVLSVDDLKRLPVHTVQTPAGEGARAAAQRTYTGALLADVIRAAKPVERRPRELRASYVLVTATDGYRVVFSWAELFTSAFGKTTVIAYERDGAALSPAEGPLAVVAASDTGAARHVKWLQSIELRVAP